jgi:hypothetical protein
VELFLAKRINEKGKQYKISRINISCSSLSGGSAFGMALYKNAEKTEKHKNISVK